MRRARSRRDDADPNILGALTHRDFALLWSGQTLSAVGDQMFPIILAIVVLSRGSGAAGLGVVLGAQAISFAVGTLVVATVGDRWRRSRLMISADAARAISVALIAADPRGLPEAVFVAAVVVAGTMEGMFMPAYVAIVPRLLPPGALQAGNALSTFSQNVAMAAGPLLAGVAITVVGTSASLWVDVATFAASLLTLALIRERAAAADLGGGPGEGALRQGLRQFGEGLRTVMDRPWLAASIGAATIVMTLVVAPAFLSAPIVAEQRLGGPAAYGEMFAALGVGSIIGSLIGGRIRPRRTGVVALSGVLTVAGAVGSLAILPLPGILIFWGIAGVGVSIFQVLWRTAVQKDIPDELIARVTALDWLGSQGLMPVGYALAGAIVTFTGARDLLLAGALLVLLVAPAPLLTRGGTTFSSQVAPERVPETS
jgi:MFS family permease